MTTVSSIGGVVLSASDLFLVSVILILEQVDLASDVVHLGLLLAVFLIGNGVVGLVSFDLLPELGQPLLFA